MEDQQKNDSLFWKACGYGDLGEVRCLLAQGANIDVAAGEGWTALMNAVLFDKPDVVGFLVEQGADLSLASTRTRERAVHVAARTGKLPYVQGFLAAGESLHGLDGGRLLCCAAMSGSAALLRFLVEEGIEVDRRGDRGDTALHQAASVEAALYLLESGGASFINFPNDDGETPLYRAAAANLPDVVSVLLAHGADINVRDLEGAPAVVRAAEGKLYDMVARLLEEGACVEFVTTYGATLGSLAAEDATLAQIVDAHAAHTAVLRTLGCVRDQDSVSQ